MKHLRLIHSHARRVAADRLPAHLVVIALIAVLLVAAGPAALPALAQGNAPEPVKVLVEDLTESSAADFGRGQARGIAIAGDAERARLQGPEGEFVSGEMRLPFAATHLGLHWIIRGGSPESVQVAVRTSQNGQIWSDWYPLIVEVTTELFGGQEVFAALAPGGRARSVQYRVTFGSAEGVTLEAMTVTAINSAPAAGAPSAGKPPKPPAVIPVALTAGGVTINVITREGWGCDESLRFRGRAEKWPEMYVPVKKIIIHHTATSNTYTDGAAEVRAIYTYHVRTLGWGDIGYNTLVDQDGKIYEGRHGRGEKAYPNREILGDDVVAGHALAYNYGSTGIAAIGNSNTDMRTDKLLPALENAVAFEAARQQIYPLGSSDFLRSDGVWHGTAANNIAGHSEVNATDCPGTYLTGQLLTLRNDVAARLQNLSAAWTAPTLSVSVVGLNASNAGTTATFAISGDDATSWSLEGWYKATGAEPITYLKGYSTGSAYYPADPGAYVQEVWPTGTWSKDTEMQFGPLQPGHYSMRVRNGGYESNVTFLVE